MSIITFSNITSTVLPIYDESEKSWLLPLNHVYHTPLCVCVWGGGQSQKYLKSMCFCYIFLNVLVMSILSLSFNKIEREIQIFPI